MATGVCGLFNCPIMVSTTPTAHLHDRLPPRPPRAPRWPTRPAHKVVDGVTKRPRDTPRLSSRALVRRPDPRRPCRADLRGQRAVLGGRPTTNNEANMVRSEVEWRGRYERDREREWERERSTHLAGQRKLSSRHRRATRSHRRCEHAWTCSAWEGQAEAAEVSAEHRSSSRKGEGGPEGEAC
jgi:hypothetical protein